VVDVGAVVGVEVDRHPRRGGGCRGAGED
jgi:hypothetical protein